MPTIADLKKVWNPAPRGVGGAEFDAISSQYNYWGNPNFESDIAGVIGQGSTVAQSGVQAKYGTKSLEMTAIAAATAYYVNWPLQVPARPMANGGETWICGCWIYTPRAANVQVHNQLWDTSNALVANLNKVTAVPATTWTWVESNYQTLGAVGREISPAILVQAAGVVAGEKTYIDGVAVRRATAAIDAQVNASGDRTYPWTGGIKPEAMSLADVRRAWLLSLFPGSNNRSNADLHKMFLDMQAATNPNAGSLGDKEFDWLGGA